MLYVPGLIECKLWERFRKQLSQNTSLELGVSGNQAWTNSSLRIHKIVLLQDDKVCEHSELEIEGENKNRVGGGKQLFVSIWMCGHGRWWLAISLFIFVTLKELYILKTGELSGGNEIIVSEEIHRFVCIWILP